MVRLARLARDPVIEEIGFCLLRAAYACDWGSWCFQRAAVRWVQWMIPEAGPAPPVPPPPSFAAKCGRTDE